MGRGRLCFNYFVRKDKWSSDFFGGVFCSQSLKENANTAPNLPATQTKKQQYCRHVILGLYPAAINQAGKEACDPQVSKTIYNKHCQTSSEQWPPVNALNTHAGFLLPAATPRHTRLGP